jgi:hypothetical protein
MLCFAGAGIAQPQASRFGSVSDQELDMTIYAPDSSASAVILFDIGQSELQYNQSKGSFEIKYTRHVRIKILTTDGFDWTDFSIPLYSSQGQRERLSRIRAHTFNKTNGKVERESLKNSDIIDERSTERRTYRKFTMPKVRVGSVIDVNYDITSDFFFNFQDWNFQYTIPVIASSYTTIIPEYYSYRRHMTGYVDVKVKTSSSTQTIIFRDQSRHTYRTDISTYYAENVEALPFESFVDNRNNYRSGIEFELQSIYFPGSTFREFTSTWESVVKELTDHSDFGGQLTGTRYLRDDVSNLIDESQDVEEQLKTVYDFIRQKISWNQRHRLFATDGARQAYRNGSGNSAEINFNLINALRELGFNAMPVALSTRSNGRIFPHQITVSRFNHVIALVRKDGKDYLMDATSSFPNPFILPAECLNEKGRIIDTQANNWIDLDKAGTSRSVTLVSSSMNENGSLTGTVNTLHSNYQAAYLFRQTNTEARLENFTNTLAKRYKNAEINIDEAGIDASNPDQFISIFSFETDEPAAIAGDMIYLDPMVGFEFDLNPFRQHTRKLPVNFTYPQEIQYSNRIAIPEGYELESAPANINIGLPQGDCRFLFSASLLNNEVVINSRLTINRIIYSSDEYQDLKAFFDAVIKKQEEKVVLKKI